MAGVKSAANWVPDRKDIIWIDCSPQAGREMRDIHPFLVLSTRAFNDRTSLVVGLPMTTAAYNQDNPFALPVGKVRKGRDTVEAYVLCHQPKSFDWRSRAAKPHSMKRLPDNVFTEACAVLNQIVQLT
jgi:mRNA interferase MazF